MKYIISVFLWALLLWPVYATTENALDNDAYFDAVKKASWEHIPETDSWMKIVFEGENEQVFMIEKIILRSHTKRLIGGAVRFSVQSRCAESHQTRIVVWTAGSEVGRLVSCANTPSSIRIPPNVTEKLSPFPKEIEELLSEMGTEGKKENVF